MCQQLWRKKTEFKYLHNVIRSVSVDTIRVLGLIGTNRLASNVHTVQNNVGRVLDEEVVLGRVDHAERTDCAALETVDTEEDWTKSECVGVVSVVPNLSVAI